MEIGAWPTDHISSYFKSSVLFLSFFIFFPTKFLVSLSICFLEYGISIFEKEDFTTAFFRLY